MHPLFSIREPLALPYMLLEKPSRSSYRYCIARIDSPIRSLIRLSRQVNRCGLATSILAELNRPTSSEYVMGPQSRPAQFSTPPRLLHNSQSHQLPGKKAAERHANLGSMIDALREETPLLLSRSLDSGLLDRDILLRMCPTFFDEFHYYLPNIKGHTSYMATMKTLRWIMTSFVLNPRVMIHIQSMRTSQLPDKQAVYPDSTKIYVRWTTCPAECPHLSTSKVTLEQAADLTDRNKPWPPRSFHSTSDAILGSHTWSRQATFSRLQKEPSTSDEFSTFHELPRTLWDLSKTLVGLSREDHKLERIISGIFIFELNETNDQIIAHTIENVELLEREEPATATSGLRVC